MDLESIVRRCQAGDREAFGALYQALLAPMRRLVAHYVHDSATVHDILHDGFIIAFTSINSLKDASKLRPWLSSIMKNLALQYLQSSSNLQRVSIEDSLATDIADDEGSQANELSWEELNGIISQLPEGYGKVFRMAVLDGLTHKEIGEILGIAPHSSSSQLAHAKALLRRLVTRRRMEIGSLSIIAVLLIIWYGLSRRNPAQNETIVTENSSDNDSPKLDSIPAEDSDTDSIGHIEKIRLDKQVQSHRDEITAIDTPADNVPALENDSLPADSLPRILAPLPKDVFMAEEEMFGIHTKKANDWSLSLAYSGALGQNELRRYLIPDPGIPNAEGPTGEIEVTEKTRHAMPLVIGLSVNKPLTARWSIDAGLRYTLLRTDIHLESKRTTEDATQSIHYIGVPLKFNYRVFTLGGFSLYGQAGGALDIPVYGRKSVLKFTSESPIPSAETFRIHAPLQWSVEGGLGLQYHFTPTFSIFAEPSIRYYFNTNSEIKTIRQEKPLEFTVPIGVRITW